MEVYNIPEHGHADAYLIQGTELNSQLTSPIIEQIGTMYNNVAPEFAVQQGVYYPTTTNYGYICTGMESPNDWNDHQRIFGLDGQEIQYAGAQAENFPYLYYTPSYEYTESPYNPYNPYIPGAMIGIDGSYIGSQQYYTVPSYENTVTTPGYYPMVVQSGPDIYPNSTFEPFRDVASSVPSRTDGPVLKHHLSPASAAFSLNPSRITSNLTNSFTRGSGGSKINAGPSKQHVPHGSVPSNGYSKTTVSNVFQGRGTQTVDNLSHGKVWSNRNQVKVSQPGNVMSSFVSSVQGRTVMDKVQTKFNAGHGSPDVSSEQNRGPRTSKSTKILAVKAFTSKTGEGDPQGNIIIHTDQYNKDDFPVDYVNAKFYTIKSYSEDDVHKSIKYNVWSSTPNGNKKLNVAYDDARRMAGEDPKGCPIFLFFSVNASGQYCGVAEMTGAVDFYKDMDFWQQDKWHGSFPVKWHIIKDVPNPNFRHIILENNENKPVTNSRDTQEIRYKKGVEMLKIFKQYTAKTSLLDDFMYYENRQKLMQQEKSSLLIKSYENPFILSRIEPRKLNGVLNLPLNEIAKIEKKDESNLEKVSISTAPVLADEVDKGVEKDNNTSATVTTDYKVEEENGLLKIGSLSINPKKAVDMNAVDGAGAGAGAGANSPVATLPVDTVNAAKPVDIVTVGSMPVKVNGYAKTVGSLTVGTIPLDPRVHNANGTGLSAKTGSKKG
ncbi:uncharacterized protein LOC141676971 [Apium graveolens]|uniref:uncharacterized protein LOC141676971 n=1 Tax=Apium graveolens TaxID=4045 RepID=UPI003D796C15